MSNDFKGKTVLITGGASGIGFSTVKEFVKSGSNVIIADINEKALIEAKEKLKDFTSNISTYQIDITKEKEVKKMVDWVKKEFGGISVLINNAGIGHSAEIIETPIKKWKQLIDVNLMGPLYNIYGFLPLMIEQNKGHIVNISSGQAYFRLPTWGAYASIKLAMGAVSEILRFELKKFNINVTTVYPYMVNTGFYDNIDGDTFAQKLSMKLLPYYSQTPQTVGKIIFKAVKKKKPVEMVNILNDVAFVMRALPPIANIVSSATIFFLGKKADILKEELR